MERHAAAPDGEARKSVILIQDAHANYEAQQHLAALLDRLATTYGVRLVLVEGGDGDIGLASMRTRGSKRARQLLAQQYLKDGLLSGEEYLDVVSDLPLILWGVDDAARHEAHFDRFLEIERLQPGLQRDLAALRRVCNQLVDRLPDAPLRQLIERRRAFEAEEIMLSAYVKFLAELNQTAGGTPIATGSQLGKFLEVTRLERALDSAAVNREQAEALAQLRGVASAEELKPLAEAAARLKAGTATTGQFAARLSALLDRHQLARGQWPALDRYLRYQQLRGDIQLKGLLREVDRLADQLTRRVAASPQERSLIDIERALAQCERLAQLKWMPDDYAALQRVDTRLWPGWWVPPLREQANAAGVRMTWSGDAAELETRLKRAVAFYDAAEGRDEAMISRVTAKMQQTGEPAAVLIVGGFHAEALADRLVRQGIDVAIVTPRVGEEEPGRYATILKRKFWDRRPRARNVVAQRPVPAGESAGAQP